MPDCILVNLNWRRLAHSTRFNPCSPVLPLELCYIASGLKDAGISASVLDLWVLNAEIAGFREEIANAKILVVNSAPAYVYWRCCPLELKVAEDALAELRKTNRNAKIIVIGPHGTVRPETFYGTEADFIVRGEPELTTCELAKGILRGKKREPRGVCHKQNGRWSGCKEVPEVKNLDKLPMLDYGFFPIERYAIHNGPGDFRGKATVYEASRGCPFDCIYCFRAGFRKKFRKKSIGRIGQELEEMKRLGIGFVYLIDECFALDKEWARGVCSKLRESGFKWSCMTRPELLEPELITLMGKSGCLNVCLGVESANTNVLRAIGKGTLDLGRLKRHIALLLAGGIQPWLFFMVGSPGETAGTLDDSVRFLSGLPLGRVRASFGLMLPYPETRLWRMAKQEHGEIGWEESIRFSGTIGNRFTKKSITRAMLLFGYRLRLAEIAQSPSPGKLAALVPETAEFALKYSFPEKSAQNSRVFAFLGRFRH